MSCERNRSEIRDVALGADPSRPLEAHLDSCPACRAVLEEDRRRLAEIDAEIGKAVSVEPSPSLLRRVLDTAAQREHAATRGRLSLLLPLAASLVALAVLIPLARRGSLPSGRPPSAPSPPVSTSAPVVSEAEVPPIAAAPRAPSGPATGGWGGGDSPTAPARAQPPRRKATARAARAEVEPEVIVPPGGEEALMRYVQAIRHSRLLHEVVLGPGADAVDWAAPRSMRQRAGADERAPEDLAESGSDTEAPTRGD